MTASLRISNMPVTSDTRNRVVAVPARIQGYNTLDKKIKGLGLRVTPYGRKIWFLQVMVGKRLPYFRAFDPVFLASAFLGAAFLAGAVFGESTQPARFSVAICSITFIPAGLSFRHGI